LELPVLENHAFRHINHFLLAAPRSFGFCKGWLVVDDLCAHRLERCQQALEEARLQADQAIEALRAQHSLTERVHHAVLRLLDCQKRSELSALLADEMAGIFALDAVVLGLEVDIIPSDERVAETGTAWLRPGQVEALLAGRPHLWVAEGDAPEELFGAMAPLLASYGVMALGPVQGRPGVLALGSRHPGLLAATGQGTGLWRFLAGVVAHQLLLVA
jgi:uncharacterized protein YigA (DUF484 family)